MLKQQNKYYFSTEGETEKWYLEHLQKLINNDISLTNKVNFTIKITRPKSFVKTQQFLQKATFYHICDIESSEHEYINMIKKIIDEMKYAGKEKSVSYVLGYSNLTFELWLLLHKTNCNKIFTDRRSYLNEINRVFKRHYQSLSEYKEENHFKEILSEITLDDVKNAIQRAKNIMNTNKKNYIPQQYKGYFFYKENPSTELGNIIEKILKEIQ